MSRLIVRNLPRKADAEDVRRHFAECGTVTDVRVLTTADGRPRRVAFVGFKEEGLCPAVVSRMDGTYLLTSKIFVEPAKTRSEIARAERLSRAEREEREAERRARRCRGALDVLDSIRERGGAELEEFLRIGRQRAWEDGVGGEGERRGRSGDGNGREGSGNTDNTDNTGNGDDTDDSEVHETALGGPGDEKARAPGSGAPGDPASGPTANPPPDPDLDDARIKLTGLPPGVTEDELAEAFSRYGQVSQAVVCIDRLSKERTGVGFVTFAVPEAASRALQAEERVIQGKVARISPARALRGPGEALGGGVRRREYLARGRDTHNRLAWDAAHQRPDTVAALVSHRLGVDLTAVAGNAVGMAVAEAVLAGEARERLEACGLVLDAPDAAAAPRSKTAILCKNLPEDVGADEVRDLFAAHGTVASCEVPYPGFALVFMAEPADARRAFGRLAFKRVGRKKAPMFLEYAMLRDGGAQGVGAPEGQAAPKDETAPQSAPQPPGPPVTLRVKNVSFSTTNEDFQRVCAALPGHVSSRLVLNSKGHSGYGFATYRSPAEAEAAAARLNSAIQAGFRWSAEPAASEARGGADPRAYGGDSLPETTKLIVKNLAFQASGRELKQLLGQFGTMVAFRAPKKVDGTLRGFAFVEYATPKDALEAARRIAATHFYGRHLVPEFSTREEGLGAAEDADGRGGEAPEKGERASGGRRRQKR